MRRTAKDYVARRIQKPTKLKPVPLCQWCGHPLKDPEDCVFFEGKDRKERFFHVKCWKAWTVDV